MVTVHNVKKSEEQRKLIEEQGKKTHSDTTAIRVSTEVYESLRRKAFFERTTIRKIADDILEEYLCG